MTGLLPGLHNFRHEFTVLEVIVEFIRLNGLVDQQILCKASELFTVLGQDFLTAFCRFVKDRLDFFIDDCRRLFGIALRLTEITPDEDTVPRGVVQNGAKPLAHAVLHHHVACQRTGLLNITGGSCGDIVQEEFFRDAAAKRDDDVFKHLFF